MVKGEKLGPYTIVEKLGEGGMGQVFRARDTKLDRDVAIKVLPEAFAHDTERLARFAREAKTLASLNHPHIAAIYGLEEIGGITALVMELVEGDDLSQRIARGAIPLEEALPIARQIAEALEAAHEQGIIHRDLKPANIKVRTDGTVKVLDFGLAKALDANPSSATADNSPTIASPAMTEAGMILGTAAYMSPEQARGKVVDKRADIWAFGVVFCEMLTGARLFASDSIPETLALIFSHEPDLTTLPAATPPRVRTLIARCLVKDARQRLRDIGDARYEVERGLDGPGAEAVSTPRSGGWRSALPWIASGLASALAAVSLARPQPTAPPPARLVQVDVRVSGNASLVPESGPAVVLSPDGSLLVFIARRIGDVGQLFLRRLDQLEATALPGTENARSPFFSPDGQWVGFFANGKLKKVPIAGGTVVVLCDAPNGRGASWAEEGWIAFTPSSSGGTALRRVSAAGGLPEPLTVLAEGQATHRWPQVLPGAKAVLYSSSKNLGSYNDGDIVVQPLPAGTPTTLVSGGHFGRYVSSGHLTYVHDGRLFAVAFDLDQLQIVGSPVPVLETVSRNVSNGGAQFAVSDVGTAVYLPGRTDAARPLHWLRRDGTTTVFDPIPRDWSNPRVSPRGDRVAVDIADGQQSDVWLYDRDRDTPSRLTFDPAEDTMPVWSPDGMRVVFRATRTSFAFNLFWQRADGGGTAERLTDSRNPQSPYSWHPAGDVLAFVETSPTTNFDIMLRPLGGSSTSRAAPTPFLNTPAEEFSPAFSPDGRWIAYVSNESGRNGVYVRPYPGPGGQWLIAPEGSDPTWSRAGRELVFLGPDQRLMVTSYSVDAESFRAGPPRPWASARAVNRPRGLASLDGRAFDLHPDGERAIGAWLSESETMAPLNNVVMVFNFFDELRRAAPFR